MTIPGEDILLIRRSLSELPRAANVAPNGEIDPDSILILDAHRAALDAGRALVVGNRGMGKSFWAHALSSPVARARVAQTVRELDTTDVRVGFNASERSLPPTPTPLDIREAFRQGVAPSVIWRAVLIRIAQSPNQEGEMEQFVQTALWCQAHAEEVQKKLTLLDDQFAYRGQRMLVVFDALDRLGSDHDQELRKELLKLALACLSYRALRLKIFMRPDQVDEQALFQFPDASKIKSTRVDLKWSAEDLYELLFMRLSAAESPEAAIAFKRICNDPHAIARSDQYKSVVVALAGERMGTGQKKGRVHSWVPLHLRDARGEASPRTFLTAWSEAAKHHPAPVDRVVDHLGIQAGVRSASEDRVNELTEDYPWITDALSPLRDASVPMPKDELLRLWDSKEDPSTLLTTLQSIGVMEVRANGKIDVPDIFRIEAGIKRRGGIPPRLRVRT